MTENAGFGASAHRVILDMKGNCELLIIAPITNRTQIKANIKGLRLAKEYSPSEFMLLNPRVGIFAVSGTRVEKNKKATDALISMKSPVKSVINSFFELF